MPPMLRGLLATLALVAAVFAAAAVRYGPPAPRGADAPPADFSATRARDALARVLGPASPHPAGSDAQAQVRDRLVHELEASGWAPRIERSFACGSRGACAFVENVVATLDGARGRGGPTVLLSAHYDSVPAGPGASDDGIGIAAVLESARALRAATPPPNGVTILLT